MVLAEPAELLVPPLPPSPERAAQAVLAGVVSVRMPSAS